MRDTIIELCGITKLFDGVPVLKGISFEIKRGECLVIAGANGSGKTVLAKIIAGILPHDGGSVGFFGGMRRDAVGLVFQNADTQILGETATEDAGIGPENLKLPEEEVKERVHEALCDAGLLAKADYPPSALSGGEKRRLAMAGIIAMKREVLILDEPFAHLDYPSVASTLRLIISLKESGKTIVLITHETEKCLALAEKLAVLCEGRLAAFGAPLEVLDALEPGWGLRDPRFSYKSIKDCLWL